MKEELLKSFRAKHQAAHAEFNRWVSALHQRVQDPETQAALRRLLEEDCAHFAAAQCVHENIDHAAVSAIRCNDEAILHCLLSQEERVNPIVLHALARVLEEHGFSAWVEAGWIVHVRLPIH